MTRTARGFAFLAIVVALAAVAMPIPAPKAQASHGDGPRFTAWLLPGASITYDQNQQYCLIDSRVGMQEFGNHGVQRFKWRMRAYDAENYVAQDFLSGIRQTWGWYHSSYFPGNTLSYAWGQTLNAWIRITPTSTGLKPSWVIRVKAVGIRPSFWKPDYKAWVTVGTCSYLDAIEGGS